MHGEIGLESELGRGTTTRFWLPFHKTRLGISTPPMGDARLNREAMQRDLIDSKNDSALHTSSGNDKRTPRPHPGPLRLPHIREQVFEEQPKTVEVDRKDVHVLIVEDKLVDLQNPVGKYITDGIAPSTKSSPSRLLKNLAFQSVQSGMAKKRSIIF